MNPRLSLLLSVLLLAGAPSLPAAAQDAGVLRYAPDAPQLAALHIEAVQLRPRPLSAPLNGRIAYDEDRTSRISAPIAGRVTRIAAKPGDRVRRGQPLLWMDSPDLGSAVADADRAAAELAQAQAAHRRAQLLFSGQVLARKDLELARTDLRKAEAEAQRARMRLRNLLPDGGNPHGESYPLRSPVSGIVTDRQVNPGMEIRPDLPNPLFVITDPAHVWAIVDLAEQDLAKVRVGQPAAISVDAYPGENFVGRISYVADVVDPGTRRVRARVELDNPDRRLKPDMFARITPLAGQGQLALLVPNGALVTEGRRVSVFVEARPGELRKRPVRLGLQTRDFSVVESGLRPGERVVSSGALLLNADLQGG